jgi:hypothetical protein
MHQPLRIDLAARPFRATRNIRCLNWNLKSLSLNNLTDRLYWSKELSGAARMRTKIFLLTLLLNLNVSVDSRAQGQMPFVYQIENTAADYPKPTLPTLSKLPAIAALPDPFAWADGRGRISNFSDWRYRRAEIGAQIQNYEIGQKPVRPDTITASYSGGVLAVNVTVNGKTLTLTSQVILPAGTGPFPAVIGMNSPTGSLPSTIFSSRNIAQITFNHNQVTTYNNPQNSDPYYVLYGPVLNIDNAGQYSAWAWGVSRIIDGLELVQNSLPIDLKHLAVTGCSYAGKMALFAGAFDERIALTIAQESGGGGATSWRYSQTEPSGSVETLGATSHQWFSEGMFQFAGTNVSKLPEDHHELCAMCAPRALYVTANPDYTWLSNPSCYVNSKATQPVYTALGIPDRFGFSIIGGHLHCAIPGSQTPDIEAFVEKFLLGIDTVNTNIATTPYNTDLSPWIPWTTPTLSDGTSLIKWTSLRFPSDLRTGLDTTITFRWTKTQDVTQYLIQVSLDPDFTSLERSDSTGTDTAKTFTGLLKGKQYFWRVKVQSVGGVCLWSNVWRFITIASPGKPQLNQVTPIQGQPGNATYTWNRVQGADQYLIQVSLLEPYNRPFRSGLTSDTVKTFSGHTEGQQYSWQVQASNIAGAGPWSNVSSFTFATTDVQGESGTPTEFFMHQNYPNPFNPTTGIRYQVSGVSDVKLSVFDVLGREVAVPVNEKKAPGNYEVKFDATGLASGVYIYRLNARQSDGGLAGSFVQSKTMLLLK